MTIGHLTLALVVAAVAVLLPTANLLEHFPWDGENRDYRIIRFQKISAPDRLSPEESSRSGGAAITAKVPNGRYYTNRAV